MEQNGFDPDREICRQEITPAKKVVALLVSFLCLAVVIAVCVGLGSILLFEGREVDISVATSGEHYTERVTFKVENVLGMDLLLCEEEGASAMLQKFSENEWVDVCEIRFSRENGAAVSAKYGGQFSHLAAGESLHYTLDGTLLEQMESGTYRLAVHYISEEGYAKYLEELAERIEASIDAAAGEPEVPETSEESVRDESTEESAPEVGPESEDGDTDPEGSAGEVSEESEEPEPVPVPEIQALYKVFSFKSREDVVEESETTAGSLDQAH